MEVLIVFLVILAITALLYWASIQLAFPPPVAVVIAVVGVLIALWYLGVNADEIDLDDDDGKNGLIVGPVAWLLRRRSGA